MIEKKSLPGLSLCLFLALFASLLSSLELAGFKLDIIGGPVFSILIGMLLTASFPKLAKKEVLIPGITFTSKKILQYAVILLGFSLNLNLIMRVGLQSMPIIGSTILTSLIVAFVFMKILKLDSNTACLIGVGSSICGGSAIAATAPVIGASDEEIAQSISVIFIFNVIAAFIFPLLGYKIGLGTEGFAIFAGSAVNDTSSVTAVASTAEAIYGSDQILSAAVTVKLTRTLAIIPITLILALWRTKKEKSQNQENTQVSFKKIFPWFILYFLAASLITSLFSSLDDSAFAAFYQESFVPAMKSLSKLFIAMAMAAIGLNTNIVNLIKKGGKPILLGFVCWMSILSVSLLVQHAFGLFYSNL